MFLVFRQARQQCRESHHDQQLPSKTHSGDKVPCSVGLIWIAPLNNTIWLMHTRPTQRGRHNTTTPQSKLETSYPYNNITTIT
ncbi:hypothetical protein E2C01_095973 [Portunus trituberculatus]|uniref:Uncharacterized protein n=1 Tax=Portunus trituberculatus TaxID=210409 RepID=A0A5B7K5E4_PORTR|nr:hypothetical protein [Portunus trituberculatus]